MFPRLKRARHAAAASLLAAGAAMAAGDPAQSEDSSARARLLAWIDLDSAGRMIEFRAFGEANRATGARYRMKITRTGPSGRSSTSQGGAVEFATPDEATVLSTTTLNVEPGASVSVELILSTTDGAEARATVEIPDAAQR